MGIPISLKARDIIFFIDDFMDAAIMSINNLKSQILFFKTRLEIQFHVSHILGISWGSLPFKYLGVPLLDVSIHNSSLEDILTKINKNISSWEFHTLNIAIPIILLKYVLQAIPLYAFSTLATPKRILKSTKNIQRNVFW